MSHHDITILPTSNGGHSWDCACGERCPNIYSAMLGAVTSAAEHLVVDFLEDLDEPFKLEAINIIESVDG